ncbi:probable LRR receptor-like serine/threonine-protein kinase At2g16250 [Selaginella moellendorffii]|uniref:probable LRR receptor-like serine/threonine-protein kinase At2g16250 n=1 Tax=Selaginella moellendorffii TaxID=88036 RepID=UPI000D1C7995|nr:probable LRR receptor-like serine/threonine-protein kinase At2g16250 [Selaginella moellendorffii]|eukprot:XP_024518615.1 probable LRR receptor-like serine/threonine-protein kinase At2g16250 [Selaginella moellendorffii]
MIMGAPPGGKLLLALSLLLSIEPLHSSSSGGGDIKISSRGDAFALRHLRYSLQVRNFYWPKSAQDPCSSWRGIQCDEQGRVVGIHLAGLKRTVAGMAQPSFSVDPLRSLPLLRYLNASGFHARGLLPYWIGELSQLQVLDLSSCSGLQGSIPDSLGQLRQLKFLSLSGNNLTGGLPYSLGNLVALEALNLSSNGLSGGIPGSFQAMRRLVTLDVSRNLLDELPRLGSGDSGGVNGSQPWFERIEVLDLSSNRINSSLPPELGKLASLRVLDLSRNSLGGTIPAGIGSLARLTKMDLSRNNLTGFLPRELSSLARMEALVLSHNEFYGSLPEGLTALKSMAFLDLSSDYLNGTVPDEITYTTALAGNCFENVARQRYQKDCQRFYTSRGLELSGEVGMLPTATPIVGSSLGGRLAGSNKKSKKQHVAAILGGILGSFGFIIAVVAIVHAFQLRDQRRRRRSSSSSKDDRGSQQTGGSMRHHDQEQANVTVNLACIGEAFSFAQLQRSTQDFNPVNLIKAGHTGDLYRGILDGGLLVVVKRVDVTSLKKDFLLSELEFFSKASHTRLVPLLGHCLERENEKFLVYKYMQHGDLARALHRKIVPSPPKDILQSLDWITRLKIAIGAAEGLSYLHHECSPALVHRDIKATSILLDDKFEVRLGSLSEARIQDGGVHPNLIMRFLRSRSQTSEQDPDSPVASCAYDVYCFGKVLLELVSGKLGISGTMDPGADTWVETILPLIDRHEKENLSKIVDSSLLVDDDLLEEVWAVAIVAKMCLNPKPSRRPAIRQVLKALENPQRVVREENFTASLRRSSHSSWNGSLFGSWRHSSSETVIPATLKEESLQPDHYGGASSIRKHSHSQGSFQDHGHHHRRPGSSEIFPEPLEGQQHHQHHS